MNKKVLVFGSGISGIGATRLLEAVGKQVVLYDGNSSLDPEKMKAQIGEGTKAEIVLGELSDEVIAVIPVGYYEGFLGVDQIICQTDSPVFIPVSEINLRMTMGLIARNQYDFSLANPEIFL